MSIYINEFWVVLFGSFCGFIIADFIRGFIKGIRKAVKEHENKPPKEYYVIKKAYCNTNISENKNNQEETTETLNLRLKKVCADNMNLRGTLREIRDYAAKIKPQTPDLIEIRAKVREVLK